MLVFTTLKWCNLYIDVFLFDLILEGKACISKTNSSVDFIKMNFGIFSQFASLGNLFQLHTNFSVVSCFLIVLIAGYKDAVLPKIRRNTTVYIAGSSASSLSTADRRSGTEA